MYTPFLLYKGGGIRGYTLQGHVILMQDKYCTLVRSVTLKIQTSCVQQSHINALQYFFAKKRNIKKILFDFVAALISCDFVWLA